MLRLLLFQIKKVSLADYVIIMAAISAIISLFSYTCLSVTEREIYPDMTSMIGGLVTGAFVSAGFKGRRPRNSIIQNEIVDYLLIVVVSLTTVLVVEYHLLNWLGKTEPEGLAPLINGLVMAAFAGTNFRGARSNNVANSHSELE
jgi:hypothetical protein